MSNENAEDIPKRRRYKMILDPDYDSSMLSRKREMAWKKAAEEKLTKIKERKCKNIRKNLFNSRKMLSAYFIIFNNISDSQKFSSTPKPFFE